MKIALLTTDSREHFKDYSNPKPYFGTAPAALLQGFAQLPEVEVHVICCVRQRVAAPEKIAPNIFYHALLVPKIGWMSTGYQGCIRAVRTLLKRLAPDIVHGQGTERDCAISAVFSGYPNVVTIHGNMAELARIFRAPIRSYNWFAARLEDFALPRTAGVFCNSAYTESLVRARAKRTWRVPNAIRAEFFEQTAVSQPQGKPCVINVGLISARKRQIEILEVVRALHEQGKQVEIQFVGACSPTQVYGAAFLRAIEQAEREGYGRYLGEKSVEELIALFDAADAMIHFPSEEAFGLVVAEALARNLKLFGSSVGGVVDIAAGIEGAELYGIDDWDGLQAGIARWLKESCPKPETAAAEMRRRYHPETIARRHIEIYREVLETSR